VRNGNIFIGLQPLRGFLEKAMEIYESTDLVMPHQYLAYYRWLKEDFGVHAIIHVGTMGHLSGCRKKCRTFGRMFPGYCA
jgi:cobaltochelatase CobN